MSLPLTLPRSLLFIDASPQWFQDKTRQQQDEYFRQSIDWLEKRHGKENVVGWSIHRDESSPHLVAYVVPMSDRGTLNTKQWTGGAAALSKMQTEFAKTVGSRNDLERGIEGSNPSKVDWPEVEKAAIYASITQHRQEPKSVLSAIVKHSPGTVDQMRQDKAREFISNWVGKDIAAPRKSKEREGSSI